MKIGFFDSGIGGLTIFKEALKRINAEYMYLGDNLNAPYGIKEKKQVKKYIFDNIDFLVKNGCKIIVIACNTATSLAVNELREKYPGICIIGTEPAVKIAVDSENVKRILVCATSITLKEGKLKKLIEKLNAESIVDLINLDKLVKFAESEDIDLTKKEINEKVKIYLEESFNNFNYSDYSHVVLGCTHFPLFKKEFQDLFGDNVNIIDGSTGVVNNLENKIKNIYGDKKIEQSNVKLVITKESQTFKNKFEDITNVKKFEVIIKC